MREATLCFPIDSAKSRVLLGLKKRSFGMGKWNGFGGKISDGETIPAATVRELFEECQITANENDLQHAGELTFLSENKQTGNWQVHVYTLQKWTGKPVETDEMKPQWFSLNTLPLKQMWADDVHWLPDVLAGKKIKAQFWFAADDETINRVQVNELTDTLTIYFGASVTGGREMQAEYEKLVAFLQTRGTVLTTHLGKKELSDHGEDLPAENVFERNVEWIKNCDVLVADVSVPSLGVGYEIGLAEQLGKKIVCLYHQNAAKKISRMIAGNPKIKVIYYSDIPDAIEQLKKELK